MTTDDDIRKAEVELSELEALYFMTPEWRNETRKALLEMLTEAEDILRVRQGDHLLDVYVYGKDE